MIEVTIERSLYGNVQDDDFEGIVSQCEGFARSYSDGLPHLTSVLIFGVTDGIYVILGNFKVEPTPEEREVYSCLCTELMTYDSRIGRPTIVIEKVVYPGGIREPYDR